MSYIISVLIALGLLIGFIALSEYEKRRGMRLFAPLRARLDHAVEHATFILSHVDFGAFLLDETRRIATHFGHIIVHFSLQAVRAAERLLTRLVRYFRIRHAIDTAPRESMREYVKKLSDFKDHLKTTHPKVPDIQ